MVSPESFPLHIWLISLRLEAGPGPLNCTQPCLSQAVCLPQGHPRHPSLEQCNVGMLRGLTCVKLLQCACSKHMTSLFYSLYSEEDIIPMSHTGAQRG